MKTFKQHTKEVNEIFGLFNTKKSQMRRGAGNIANNVVMEKIVKPALSPFKDAFEDIKIVEDKAKDYLITGYGFKIQLDVTDKYLSLGSDGKTYYIDGDLAGKVDSAIRKKFFQWKSENKDDIISQMIPDINAMSTFEANLKNKDGRYEQNIVIRFRIIDGGINKAFKK